MRRLVITCAIAALGASILATGCSGEASPAVDASFQFDGGTGGAGGKPGDAAAQTPMLADAGSVDVGPPPIECFAGPPTTHEQILNACWPDSITAVSKPVTLPGGYKVGEPLPAIK